MTLEYLTLRFPVGYEGPVPIPTLHNHPSAVHHRSDIAAYITKELEEGAMLGPFDPAPPSFPGPKPTPYSQVPKRTLTYAESSWTCPGPFLLALVSTGVPAKSVFGGCRTRSTFLALLISVSSLNKQERDVFFMTLMSPGPTANSCWIQLIGRSSASVLKGGSTSMLAFPLASDGQPLTTKTSPTSPPGS